MNFRALIYCEISLYGAWWWIFAAIAYATARYCPSAGIRIGMLLIGVLLVAIDVDWIFTEMREHPENGRDADGIFWMGLIGRFLIFNMILLPVSITGAILRERSLRHKAWESMR